MIPSPEAIEMIWWASATTAGAVTLPLLCAFRSTRLWPPMMDRR
jgi:hypothetical protein